MKHMREAWWVGVGSTAPVYMFIFEWQARAPGGKLKASHGMELPFVFDNVDEAVEQVGTSSDLQPLADKVTARGPRFARIGNPAYETRTRRSRVGAAGLQRLAYNESLPFERGSHERVPK